MTYQIDYEMVAVVLVTGFIIVSIFYFLHIQYNKKIEAEREFFNIVTPTATPIYPKMAMHNIYSEENCQSVYGYGDQEKLYLEKYFCEFNESGWHFNRTRYDEAK